MKSAKLGDVASFIRGVTFKPADIEEASGTNVDCMRTKNVQEELDRRDVWSLPTSMVKRDDQFLRTGDLLVSSANSWNLVGKACWIPELERPSTFGGFVSVLRPHSRVIEARYLYRWFTSDMVQTRIRSFGNQTTNISNLDLKRTAGLSVPLPPLDEQRRIAAILDKADELRAKRRQALAHLDTLTQSIFHSLFGDPTSANNKTPLSELLGAIESGQSPVCDDRPALPNEWGVLKLSAVTKQEFDDTEHKALVTGEPDRRHEVRPGDVLFSRKNTPALVAAVALVRSTRPKLLLPDLIFRLQIEDQRMLIPEYLQAVLAHPRQRSTIQGLAGGSASSMSNISKAKLMTVQIPVPSLELQQSFATRVAAVERLKEKHRQHLAQLDALFASLQHRAFNGEL
ncbi:restriction endonuclease subunit S [Arthrobacter sp. QXT-31]|uniref:restriction endonuclease subunit S n=1 Tax=Arthrobacter sp. QXT-31 TaxID=1357915 RepID=UPI000971B723|nr:restriction endonuclease subunit S [Arthrobacter sp. QXT-31]APX02222.1 hypothetical protein BWQ92_11290 [Arthrobacter sp. QXT-31]